MKNFDKIAKLIKALIASKKLTASGAYASAAPAPYVYRGAVPADKPIPADWRNKIKILFLDFDGVLNAYGKATDPAPAWARGDWGGLSWVDGDKVRRLRPLLADPDFRIVIASAWRSSWSKADLGRILNDYVPGLGDRIIDVTPHRGGRGRDIKAWLDFNDFRGSYAILDDDRTDMVLHGNHYVPTPPNRGVADRHVRRVKALLGYPVVAEKHAKADAEEEAFKLAA